VAVVVRGAVPFVDKARRAAEAGAVALIVINNEDSKIRLLSSTIGTTKLFCNKLDYCHQQRR
jgi:hypothetical protein